jgi:galactose mutarotase-like enzyme
MYAALVKRTVLRAWSRAWQFTVKHSGLLIIVGIAVVLLLVAVGLKERGRGNLTRLKVELGVRRPAVPEAPPVRPGGQDAVVLEQPPLTGIPGPQFISATVLPGRGANVFQIRAYLPQLGNVDLLASPSLEDAAKQLTGEGEDAAGGESLKLGGAIEAPWAGALWGRRSDHRLLVDWQGHTLPVPVGSSGSHGRPEAVSIGGLLLKRSSDAIKRDVLPGGEQVQTIYDAGDFAGHWISHTVVTTTVQLSNHVVEINIAAQNTGNQAEPIGIGWHPRFAIPSKDRGQATLRLPSGLRAEVDRSTGRPSGRLLPVEGTRYDFTAENGVPLGTVNLDDGFVHLKPTLVDNGPVVELRDPKSDYGLRITMLSPTIKAIHVYARADEPFVVIDPQFNHDDPFGHEWAQEEDTGMVVLQPGQTAQWKVRLEIFSLKDDASQHI